MRQKFTCSKFSWMCLKSVTSADIDTRLFPSENAIKYFDVEQNTERKDTVANVVCIRLVISTQQWEHSSLAAYKHESVEFPNTVSHFPVARQYLCSLQTLPRCENRSQMWKDTMPEGDLFNFERFFGLCFIRWELRSGSGSSHPLSHVGSSQ